MFFPCTGVDENTIIEILVKRSNEQRQQIKEAYQQATGKVIGIKQRAHLKCTQDHMTSLCIFSLQPLEAALKNALKGDLEEVVLALLKTPAQYDAQQLKLAMKVHAPF